MHGASACGNVVCQQLRRKGGVAEHECSICREERRTRHRVMNDPDDKRHMQIEPVDFTSAPAIFPNNDIKYDVNKRRAEIFAVAHNQALTWCVAKDRPSTEVLNEKPNITEGKGELAPAA